MKSTLAFYMKTEAYKQDKSEFKSPKKRFSLKNLFAKKKNQKSTATPENSKMDSTISECSFVPINSEHEGLGIFRSLPRPILLEILACLPVLSLLSIGLCSKHFHQIISSEDVWKLKLCQEFPETKSEFTDRFKENYIALKQPLWINPNVSI